MHRDKRLGLALGILLLGVVAAFFFRNDGDDGSAPPSLADPKKLEGEIAENEFVPYLTGLEGAETSEATVDSDASTDSRSSARPVRESGPWDFADFLQDDGVDPSPRPANLPRCVNGPPDPIDTRVSAEGGMPIPRENEAWEPVVESSPREQGQEASPAVADADDADVIHRVRKGETLSSLAERYLGSSRRFLEIYEANRDRLRSPDDLRVGLPLRIPQAGDDATAPLPDDRVQTVPVSTSEEPPAVDAGTPTKPATVNKGADDDVSTERPVKRFLPVRRHPLTPRPIDTGGNDTQQSGARD